MRRAAALLGLLLLPACGLPMPSGVQSAGDVQGEGEVAPALRVIPPGPQPGATPEEVVAGFLTAQSSPDDDHAVARRFLAPGVVWDDERGAVVHRSRLFVADADDDPLTFDVRFDTTARIEGGGGFRLDETPTTASFTVRQQPDGEYRLTAVPQGLLLAAQDRERSFVPRDVWFLALAADGSPVDRLVPDRVFLPVDADPAEALVASLLRGPTLGIKAAVRSAVPPDTALAAPLSTSDGVLTVDLTAQAGDLDAVGRRRLAAQLVWTLLPDVTGVRLLVEGEPLDDRGVLTLEDAEQYDPAGSVEDAAVLYVRDRQVRVLEGTLPASEATTAGGVAVDEVAVSPSSGALGLLTTSSSGPDEVRTGPAAGPFGPAVLSRGVLGSLTWGPGDQGLWALDLGAQPAICLLPVGGGVPRADPCDVPYERPADAGLLTSLRISRDGARAALVFGSGEARRLYVGRVEPAGDRLRIAALAPVAPSLADVTDVAWSSGTTLAVLASSGASQVVAWTVVVDGSADPQAVQRPGLPGDALAVAAAPGRPLVVSAELEARGPVLFREDGSLFRSLGLAGTRPTYPG